MNNLNYNNMGKAPYVRLIPESPGLISGVDPDAKIRMSLDDIIQIYNPRGVAAGIARRNMLRKKPLGANLTQNFKRAPAVRLQSSYGKGHFYVANNSPLIKRNFARNREMAIQARNIERDQNIEVRAQAEMNRAINGPILQEKEELVLAKYKMIRTKNGVQRILVPATMDKPMPLIKVPVPRRPLNSFKKPPPLIDSSRNITGNKPPPLIDSALSITGSRPPPLIDSAMSTTGSVKSFQSANSSRFMRSSLSARLGPPPLIEAGSHNMQSLVVKKTYSQPPPLIESKIKPPPLIESNFKFSRVLEAKSISNMPPLVETRRNTKIPSLIDSMSNNRPPPLIEARSKSVPPLMEPPLIDISDDFDDEMDMDVDVKPPPSISGSSFRSISLNERFSNFYHQ